MCASENFDLRLGRPWWLHWIGWIVVQYDPWVRHGLPICNASISDQVVTARKSVFCMHGRDWWWWWWGLYSIELNVSWCFRLWRG